MHIGMVLDNKQPPMRDERGTAGCFLTQHSVVLEGKEPPAATLHPWLIVVPPWTRFQGETWTSQNTLTARWNNLCTPLEGLSSLRRFYKTQWTTPRKNKAPF